MKRPNSLICGTMVISILAGGIIFVATKTNPQEKFTLKNKIANQEEQIQQIGEQEVQIQLANENERITTSLTSRGTIVIRTSEQSETQEESEEQNSEQTEKAESEAEENKEQDEEEKEETKNNKKDTTKYTKISEVKISKTMDLTKTTGLSKKDFVKLISGVEQDTLGFFEDNAETIYELCQKYSINEIFFCGLISAESGWNIASNHRSTHNYISLMKNGKLIKYSSVDEGLKVAAQKLHNNYLTPGGKFYYGKTLSAVKTKFCPSSSTWVDLVYGRMKQILN